MPMYEYDCQECGAAFVQKKPFSEARLPADCPECDSSNTRKRLAAVAIISNSPASSSSPASIPVPLSNGGGCGCGGACACQN